MLKLDKKDIQIINKIFLVEAVLLSFIFSIVFLFVDLVIKNAHTLSKYSLILIIFAKAAILSALIYQVTIQHIHYQDLKQEQVNEKGVKSYSIFLKFFLYVSILPISVFTMTIINKNGAFKWDLLLIVVIYILCFVKSIFKIRNYMLKKWLINKDKRD